MPRPTQAEISSFSLFSDGSGESLHNTLLYMVDDGMFAGKRHDHCYFLFCLGFQFQIDFNFVERSQRSAVDG